MTIFDNFCAFMINASEILRLVLLLRHRIWMKHARNLRVMVTWPAIDDLLNSRLINMWFPDWCLFKIRKARYYFSVNMITIIKILIKTYTVVDSKTPSISLAIFWNVSIFSCCFHFIFIASDDGRWLRPKYRAFEVKLKADHFKKLDFEIWMNNTKYYKYSYSI